MANSTILDTFGISAENFYNGCIAANLKPHEELDKEIEKFNTGGYTAGGEIPDDKIDETQASELHADLDEYIDEIQFSTFSVRELVQKSGDCGDLHIIESVELGRHADLDSAVRHYKKCKIFRDVDGNYIGFEIVRIDDDGDILGTQGNFIKGDVISEF